MAPVSEMETVMIPDGSVAYTFIIDEDPIFAYMGWHLAHSLAVSCSASMTNVHVQLTPEVSPLIEREFRSIGCTTHRLERFGDGRYCNKLSQWDALRDIDVDHIAFLDTDMICVANLAQQLPADLIGGKIVDLANPSLPLLDTIFGRAGFTDRPTNVQVDASDDETYLGNFNGGLYSVPKRLAQSLFAAWKRHALALLDDIEPLRQHSKVSHVDQISFCMALHEIGLPAIALPSNTNYFTHFAGPHRFRDPDLPIALLHYHGSSLNILGLIESSASAEPDMVEAVAAANTQIRHNFNNRLFWDFRYAHFSERGSGVGSRGENLDYKRQLLRAQGAEAYASVLDVGSGDLEVVHVLDLHSYVGLDRSSQSLARAARIRPDWRFMLAPSPTAQPSELVLCLEVAIHQETLEDYQELIDYLARKTMCTLIVSGYDEEAPHVSTSHMVFFHEPLRQTLQRTGRFARIERIGSHTDVVIYRCDVR